MRVIDVGPLFLIIVAVIYAPTTATERRVSTTKISHFPFERAPSFKSIQFVDIPESARYRVVIGSKVNHRSTAAQ